MQQLYTWRILKALPAKCSVRAEIDPLEHPPGYASLGMGEGQGRKGGGNALLLLFTVLPSPPLSACNTQFDQVYVHHCMLKQAAFLDQAHTNMKGIHTHSPFLSKSMP